MKKILLVAGLAISVFSACKKSAPDTEPTPADPLANGSSLDKLRDSVYLYTKEAYYWNDAVPDYASFNPRSFSGTDELTSLQTELYQLSQLKFNPSTNRPYEYYPTSRAKYSYIDNGSSSTRLNATAGDFGFQPVYIDVNDLRIKYVYAGSPADIAGVKRGYQITSINGRTSLSGNSSADVAFINAALLNSSTVSMVLRKPDATTITVNLNTATYTINPIITTKVIDAGSKKVGYIVFNSFVSLSSTQAALTGAFSAFKAAGVTELVVDLRYNLGGFVQTAEYLTNLIVPSSANGKVMFNTYFNPLLTSGKAAVLKNQVRKDENNKLYDLAQIDYSVEGNVRTISKKGDLDGLTRVFFLVSGSTASAAELTINNLKPYMDVQLIGTTTFGKPVGFFAINIGKYEMYIPEFETKNAQGLGGYYSGMTPGSTTYTGKYATDDVTKEFGDTSERLLAQALNYIGKGVYTNEANSLQIQSTGTTQLTEQEKSDFINLTEKKSLNGMIFEKFPLKK